MSSLLEQARARAAARRERQMTITLSELDMELLCDVPTDSVTVERLQDAARRIDKGKAVAAHFARALVANQTREIRIAGELLMVDDQPVCFRDLELQRELGVPDAKSAVVALLGADGDIISVAASLLDEGGFSDSDGVESGPI
jgi:hypothetical protein